MQIEQISDILDWIVNYHQQIAKCYEHCSDQSESPRVKMLLDYIADHEKQLTLTIARYEEETELKDLNTWCIEYVDKAPALEHMLCESNLNEMDTNQIMVRTASIHNQLLDLYQHLVSRAGNARIRELFNDLILLEEHEIMRMVKSSEGLSDI
ncbi:ATPase [Neptuniibacter sp. SY11_33]|uniref:ATPase n=1 Tax=Neptuniibacter sp. SY11_33 TaxID=3398215 RepID=UPI0039F5032F